MKNEDLYPPQNNYESDETVMEYLKRKNLRLKDYDYSSVGAYFVTICTKDRKQLLSNIFCDTVGRGDPDAPYFGVKIALTDTGTIVDKYINSISDAYNNVHINNYVIMPEHIHLLITIDKEIPAIPERRRAGSSRPTVSRIIGALKKLITKEIGENIFQASFSDHIIRDEFDFLTKWNYIEGNPLKRFEQNK